MIELKTLPRATLDTLAFVALPHKEADRFWDSLPSGQCHTFHIFKRLYLPLDSDKSLLLSQDSMLNAQNNFLARNAPCFFHAHNFTAESPQTVGSVFRVVKDLPRLRIIRVIRVVLVGRRCQRNA